MKIRFTPQAQKKPDHNQGMRVPYIKGKRKVSFFAQWRWYVIVLIVSSPLLYLLGKIVFSYVFITAPGFLSLEKLTLNSSSAGIIDKLVIPVGEEVEKEGIVAELSSQELEEREKIAMAERDALSGQFGSQYAPGGEMETLKQKMARQELSLAMEQQSLAAKMLQYQKNHLQKVQFLLSQGAATIADLRQAEAGYNSAQYTMSTAKQRVTQQQLRIAEEREEGEKLLVLKANAPLSPQIEKLNAELVAIKNRKQRLIQKTPYRGRVLEYFVGEGQMVVSGTPLMLLARQDQPLITCYLQPKYAYYAKEGHYATVRFADGKRVRAKVMRDAKLVKRLPADLAAPIGTRDLLLLVKLLPLEQLPADLSVDGLPVKVRFHQQWSDFKERLRKNL